MKLEPPKDKYELLYQCFFLLFDPAANAQQRDEVTSMLMIMLSDPEITQDHAQIACDKAISSQTNIQILEANFNG
tara:strand:- start:522 stop:746 length:225 start_codon:yes stop_codon:yes gene_type:complete